MCALKIEDTVPSTREVVTIDHRSPLVSAIELMRRNKIHHLIVTDATGLRGVLSDRDIIEKGFAINSVVLNPIMSVGEVMHPLNVTLTDQTDVSEAIALMHREGVSALPLVSKGELTGIVTESDLLRILRLLMSAAPGDQEAGDLDAADKGRLMMGNPLIQNVMKLISEMGI